MGIVESVINEARVEGLEEGREQGLKRGREEGERSRDLAFVQSLIRNTDCDDEKIASLAAVDVRFVRKIRSSTYSSNSRKFA